tara:strand:- start:171 stop:308 length:138 start_codon:yes stop_codon:yes gene_type:complete
MRDQYDTDDEEMDDMIDLYVNQGEDWALDEMDEGAVDELMELYEL